MLYVRARAGRVRGLDSWSESAYGGDRSLGRVGTQSIERVRERLGERLRARVGEMETAIFDRILIHSEPGEIGDEEYTAGLKATIRQALELGISGIELGPEWSPPPPPGVAIQARWAVRNGVSLDTVLRRYAIGDRIVGEFLVEEADGLSGQVLSEVMRTRGPLVDMLMSQAATHYVREFERMTQSPEQRRMEIVEKLIAGGADVDLAELGYEFDCWHLGAVLVGDGAREALGEMGPRLACRTLGVQRGPRTVWAWLGYDDRPDPGALEGLLEEGPLAGLSVAIGEPRTGLDGWRLSHHEACAAHQVMLRRPQRFVRGVDVILLAAVLRDQSLTRSMLETFVVPLDASGDSGGQLRETLHAYFAAGHNAASAASALGVDRHTVMRRLRKIERLLDLQLNDCQARLEVALGLAEIDAQP